MKFRWILFYSVVGFFLQMLLHFVGAVSDTVNQYVLGSLYGPWVRLGAILDRDSASCVEIFPYMLLGYLLGILFYSLLIGVLYNYFKTIAFYK